jgi:cell division protein FtsW (lipid II flippase)
MTQGTDLTNNQNISSMVTMEKKLFAPSVMEMVFYAVMMLILLNGSVLLLFPLILKLSFIATFQKSWIILLFVPLLTGIMQPLTNQNGLLTLKGIPDPQILQQKLADMLNHFDYLETGRDDQSISLDYRTNWKRFMHYGKGGVSISIEKDEIKITGKKQILDYLETKMLFGKNFKYLNVNKI